MRQPSSDNSPHFFFTWVNFDGLLTLAIQGLNLQGSLWPRAANKHRGEKRVGHGGEPKRPLAIIPLIQFDYCCLITRSLFSYL